MKLSLLFMILTRVFISQSLKVAWELKYTSNTVLIYIYNKIVTKIQVGSLSIRIATCLLF